MDEQQFWYRFDDRRWAEGYHDEFGEWQSTGTRVTVDESKFRVLKTTPRGVWLDDFGRQRFVRQDARKRFACPTRGEALESFRARKKRQLSIMKARVALIERALAEAGAP